MMSRWNGPAGWLGLTPSWQGATLGLVTAKEGFCSGVLHSSVLNHLCFSWSPLAHHIKALQDYHAALVIHSICPIPKLPFPLRICNCSLLLDETYPLCWSLSSMGSRSVGDLSGSFDFNSQHKACLLQHNTGTTPLTLLPTSQKVIR